MAYKFYATITGTEYELHPLGVDKLQLGYTREQGARTYKLTLNGSMIFKGSEYEQLLAVEKSAARCEELPMRVERICSDGEEIIYEGTLIMNDGEWWIDGCQLSIKAVSSQDSSCIFNRWGEEVNILSQGITPRSAAWAVAGIEEVEYQLTVSSTYIPYQWFDGSLFPPALSHWVLKKNYCEQIALGVYRLTSTWVREKKIIPDTQSLSGAWILRSTSGGFKTYTRPVILYNYTIEDPILNVKNFNSQIFGYPDRSVFSNGLPLGDVLDKLAERICGTTTVVSDFFQINPENPSPDNYVTEELNQLTNLLIYQKSDIVNAGATQDATIANITLEKLLKQLNFLFNVEWIYQDGILRIEHCSYFENQPTGLDLTLTRYAANVKGKHKYSYEKDRLPSIENFKFKQHKYRDFLGAPITYDNSCATTDPKFKTVEYVTEDIITDVQMCLDQLNKEEDLDGLVLIACEDVSGELFIMMNPPYYDLISTPNNLLGWAWLHENYHKHNRAFYDGYLNYNLTQFESVRKRKRGERLSIPFCCGDVFDPLHKVITMIGAGEVDAATFKLGTDMLELDLLYDHDWPGASLGDLPVAVDDAYEVPFNTATNLPIMDNDTNPDVHPSTPILITVQPQHGAITNIYNDSSIEYTPTTGYIGADSFKYQCRDSFGQLSNEATVNITVIVGGTNPVAGNDAYTTGMDQVLAMPGYFGVLLNDTNWQGAGTFTIVASDTVSANGGTVDLGSNGGFNYTPAPGYTGLDSFTYTIENNQGLQDVGTVYIQVLPLTLLPWLRISKINQVSTLPTPPLAGEIRRHDIIIEAFTSAAATTPYVAAPLLVNWRSILTDRMPEPDTVTAQAYKNMISGTGMIVQTNILTIYTIYDTSSSSYVADFDITYQILAGAGYKII
jgi:hypothetical protein